MVQSNVLRFVLPEEINKGEQLWNLWVVRDAVIFSVENLLNKDGKKDFNIFIQAFENNDVPVDFFKEKKHAEQILFPFLDFLKEQFFFKNKEISNKIMDLIRNNLYVRDEVFEYILKNNKGILRLEHTEQDNTLSFHIFLLENKDFDIKTDISNNYFTSISLLLNDISPKIYTRLGTLIKWSNTTSNLLILQEINAYITLWETINKLALIYAAKFEEPDIPLRLGSILRTNINSLISNLNNSFLKWHVILRKLQFLSWKIQCNFAHLEPIDWLSVDEIKKQVLNIISEIDAWLKLQVTSDFWWDLSEEISSRKVCDGNKAIAELLGIKQIEKIKKNIPEMDLKKIKHLHTLNDVYNFITNKTLLSWEEIINDLIAEGIKHGYQIEAVYYIIFFNSSIKITSLERLTEFFIDKEKNNNNFYDKEFIVRILILIIHKFHNSTESSSFFNLTEKIFEFLWKEYTAHSMDTYAKIYFSLAEYYIACYMPKKRNEEEEESQDEENNEIKKSKICFLRYANLKGISINSSVVESDIINWFYLALWIREEIEWFSTQSHAEKNAIKNWIYLLKLAKINYQNEARLIINQEQAKMSSQLDAMQYNIYSQAQLNEYGQKIAQMIFYNLCTIEIVGDCISCNKFCKLPDNEVIDSENCQDMHLKRWFGRKNISLVWNSTIIFKYPLDAEKRFDQMYLEQYLWIIESFNNLIAENNKNITIDSSKKELEKRALENEKLAFYDPVTELPNENNLRKTLENDRDNVDILILIKIQNFSSINNSYGFDAGNVVLSQLTQKIKVHFAWVKIFRSNAPEFYIIFSKEEFKKYSDASVDIDLLQGIRSHLLVWEFNYIWIPLSANILISAVEWKQNDMQKKVSLSMSDLQLKNNSETVSVYSKETWLEDKYKKHLEWRGRILHTISEDRIIPYYQWLYDNNAWKINKYECLLRYNSEHGKIEPPRDFVNKADEHWLLPMVTHKMFEKVCQYMSWKEHKFSINISGKDLVDNDFINGFKKIAMECSIDFNRITIEILEQTINFNNPIINERISLLKQLGCSIALDDFGAEWSNYSRLKWIIGKDDFIKIDGQFILGIYESRLNQKIVASIVSVANELGCEVIAEFVANQQDQDTVKILGVHYSQGFLFSKPASEIVETE